MLITFKCPQCDSELEVDAAESGARINCPACSSEFRAPVPRVGPGTTLGNFAIERKIGSGGMGDVFLARQLSMDRLVALKVLPQGLTRKPGVVERFRQEVRMSARLEHPHVVTAFEAGEDFGYHYLAMSFVDGEDLRTRVRRDGSIPEKEALTYTRHIADALSYAWGNYRMLHRDVKPGNIMVDRSGKARIMDLGISKSLADGEDAELTVSGMLVGTPHYMSPEQASVGADVDCRADIYSLGATLYHVLTGMTPFPGTTTTEVLRQIGLVPVKPLREINPTLSEPCAKLVHKMIAPHREQRHPTWEAVLVDIDRVLAGREPLLVLGDGAAEAPAAAGRSAPSTAGRPPGPAAAAAPRVAAPPVREPPIAGRPLGVGDTTEFRTPPRIDLRQRRSRWLRRHVLWRVGLLALLLVLLVTAFVFVGRWVAGLKLRERAAVILARHLPEQTVSEPSPSVPEPPPELPSPSVPEPPPELPPPAPPAAGPTAPVLPPLPEAGALAAPEPTPAPRPLLEEAGERRLAALITRATDDLVGGRPDLAADALHRGARETAFAPVASELARAAAVAAEGQRERDFLAQSFTHDAGSAVTLKMRTETLRVKVLRLEGDAVATLRLYPAGDRPMGPLRVSLSELSSAEVLERLQRYAGKPAGDLVLALALLREGQYAAAQEPISRLPSLLRASLRARALAAAAAPPSP